MYSSILPSSHTYRYSEASDSQSVSPITEFCILSHIPIPCPLCTAPRRHCTIDTQPLSLPSAYRWYLACKSTCCALIRPQLCTCSARNHAEPAGAGARKHSDIPDLRDRGRQSGPAALHGGAIARLAANGPHSFSLAQTLPVSHLRGTVSPGRRHRGLRFGRMGHCSLRQQN